MESSFYDHPSALRLVEGILGWESTGLGWGVQEAMAPMLSPEGPLSTFPQACRGLDPSQI